MQHRQYCTFALNDLFLGIDVDQVQEVIRHHKMTRVPLAPKIVRGLINLRGEIVTALDLRYRLELKETEPNLRPMSIVVKSNGNIVSLLVDNIEDVIEIEEDTFEPPPDTLKGIAKELITGVFKLKDRLLLILDTYKTVVMTERKEQKNVNP